MLFFMLPFPGIIRIGAVLVIAPVSVLLAIVSFGGRRTDTWVVMFLGAAAKPTLRVWKKEAVPPETLLPSYVVPHVKTAKSSKTSNDLEDFLNFWRTQEQKKDYSDEEKAFLQKISMLSRQYEPTQSGQTVPQNIQPISASSTIPNVNVTEESEARNIEP